MINVGETQELGCYVRVEKKSSSAEYFWECGATRRYASTPFLLLHL